NPGGRSARWRTSAAAIGAQTTVRHYARGGVAERSKAVVLKTTRDARPSWVRIPAPPLGRPRRSRRPADPPGRERVGPEHSPWASGPPPRARLRTGTSRGRGARPGGSAAASERERGDEHAVLGVAEHRPEHDDDARQPRRGERRR